MKVFKDLAAIKDIDETVIALGNFDGVHRGHQELIRRMVSAARTANMKSAVFTFSNHPRNFLGSNKVFKIAGEAEKLAILEELGVDYLFNIPFDEEICHMSPEDYVDNLLIKTFRMKEVYCGFNYRFGYKAQGDTAMLMSMSLKKGFGIHVMEPFTIEEEVVSSTILRSAIESGDMIKAEKLMGRLYSVTGKVSEGEKLGRTIGFPTANLSMEESMLAPGKGVYITRCILDGKAYEAISNVGVKPTVGNYDMNIETHIFDFEGDIYGREIKVQFLKRLRDEMKFESLDDLVKQIERDCINGRAYHRSKKH